MSESSTGSKKMKRKRAKREPKPKPVQLACQRCGLWKTMEVTEARLESENHQIRVDFNCRGCGRRISKAWNVSQAIPGAAGD